MKLFERYTEMYEQAHNGNQFLQIFLHVPRQCTVILIFSYY